MPGFVSVSLLAQAALHANDARPRLRAGSVAELHSKERAEASPYGLRPWKIHLLSSRYQGERLEHQIGKQEVVVVDIENAMSSLPMSGISDSDQSV